MSDTLVVIHGHFYQPPRESPWLDEVEAEASATPWHDWNERIERECYRPVTAARLLDGEGRILRVVNTLEWLSFDAGPTLLAWLERHAPATYQAVLQADRTSRERTGFGNALAHPFHHVILPLCSRRDKETEVRWGIRDFRRRFGRDPEGMWLPETAVDDETLDVLAAAGIRYTVLAPHQVAGASATGLPGTYTTAAGRAIALFAYDGPLAHDVAFGTLLRDARAWSARIACCRSAAPRLVAMAADGETFGHHHVFGEMALAWLVSHIEASPGLAMANFTSALSRLPSGGPVELRAPSSWSCTHGIDRWRADCGCKAAPHRPSQQAWRAGLRDAVDWLAAEAHRIFERDGRAVFPDPWASREAFDPAAEPGVAGDTGSMERHRLLELEHNALRLFTSCAWFFDDIGGLESRQVLAYAARLLELAGADRARLEEGLLRRLETARSNDAEIGNGRLLFREQVQPELPPMVRIAAGCAALRASGAPPTEGLPAAYCVEEAPLADGFTRIMVQERRTGRRDVFRVTSEWVHGHEFAFTVTAEPPAEPARWMFGTAELWDRHRDLLATWRLRQLTERALSPAERARLASGEADLRGIAPGALVEAITLLLRDSAAAGLSRARSALDLLEALDLPVPLEAQLQFAPLRGTSPRLASLGRRLGFAD